MKLLAGTVGLVLAGCAASTTLQVPEAAPLGQKATAEPGLVAARHLIREAMARDGVPGMAVAVYRDDRLVWNEAFGLANIELRAPATSETLFRIGSVSKLFTGTVAARLSDRGAIDLDRPVGDYVPQWPRDKPPITLRQLLGHLSGIRHYGPELLDPFDGTPTIDFAVYPDHASILAIFADDPLLAEPGIEFHYSSYGFSLAQVALEAATGKRYFQLVEEEVLSPAGLTGIREDSFLGVVPDRTSFYDKPGWIVAGPAPEGATLIASLPLNSAYKVAAGGLLANAPALARYGLLHMRPGPLLNEQAYAELMSSQRDAQGRETGTGLAWTRRIDPFGRSALAHTGSQQGTRALLALYPREGYVVALLSNLGGHPADVVGLGGAIVDLLEGGTGDLSNREEER